MFNVIYFVVHTIRYFYPASRFSLDLRFTGLFGKIYRRKKKKCHLVTEFRENLLINLRPRWPNQRSLFRGLFNIWNANQSFRCSFNVSYYFAYRTVVFFSITFYYLLNFKFYYFPLLCIQGVPPELTQSCISRFNSVSQIMVFFQVSRNF